MERVDRRNFVPEKVKEMSYVDIPIPIGYSATISAPHMHAKCLELLEDHLLPGARALDVGSGQTPASQDSTKFGCFVSLLPHSHACPHAVQAQAT